MFTRGEGTYEVPVAGLVDTNVVILREFIDPAALPRDVAICAVTLAELAAGPGAVVGDDVGARRERARRVERLQRVENEFDPLPFDADAARVYGRIYSAVIEVSRAPRRRVADLMIAAVAASQGLPLYTTNPADFAGLAGIVDVIPVPRPTIPSEE